MNDIEGSMKCLGYDHWLQAKSDPEKMEQHELARVISVHKDSYQISKGAGDVFAELSGKLIYTTDSPVDLPTVGDWVYADFFDDDSHAIVHDILPRKTVLKRKTSGKNIEFQLIAANIDTAFIMQSLDEDFSLRRLERYLVMINESKISPVILLSKCDLISERELEEQIGHIMNIMPNVKVIPFSSENGANIDSIKSLFVHGKTYCLLGSSGVGKTTLLNHLVKDSHYETSAVREKDSKGRHTTTHRQLIQLDNGALLIDTPGMRELGNMSVESGINETFSEIIVLSKQCKFSNCTHLNEAGCAILEAIDKGQLSENRYQNYLSLKKESRYNEMSYLEKKQKDKNLGQLIKSVKKHDKRK